MVVLAAPARAVQGRLIRAGMSVAPDLSSAETTVQMKYVLRPAGDTVVPLSVVLFDSASVSRLSASVNGQIIPLDDLHGGASHRSGEIRLSLSLAARDSLPLELMYTVHTRGEFTRERIQVPVLAVTWPPEEARPGTFIATLITPMGYTAYDPLPSLLREIQNDGGAHAYEAALQVVPAMFSFRLTEGRAPRIGLSGFIDIAVLVLLAGFTWIGWRHFKAGD
jgi:hypothetical protein